MRLNMQNVYAVNYFHHSTTKLEAILNTWTTNALKGVVIILVKGQNNFCELIHNVLDRYLSIFNIFYFFTCDFFSC